MTMFKFNNCGVCINPNVIEYYHTFKFFYKIKTAYTGSMWVVGYSLQAWGDGVGSPCTANFGHIFNSEIEAIKYAAQEALEFFSKNHIGTTNDDAYVKVPKEIFSNLKNIIKPVPRQLSLFDKL